MISSIGYDRGMKTITFTPIPVLPGQARQHGPRRRARICAQDSPGRGAIDTAARPMPPSREPRELLRGPQGVLGAVIAGSALAVDAARTMVRLLSTSTTLPAPSESAVHRALLATESSRDSVERLRETAEAAEAKAHRARIDADAKEAKVAQIDEEKLIEAARAAFAAVQAQADTARGLVEAARQELQDARSRAAEVSEAAQRTRTTSAELAAAREDLGREERALGESRMEQRELSAKVARIQNDIQEQRARFEAHELEIQALQRQVDSARDAIERRKEDEGKSSRSLDELCDELEMASTEFASAVRHASTRSVTESGDVDASAVVRQTASAESLLQARLRRAEHALAAATARRERRVQAVEDVLRDSTEADHVI